MANFTMTTVDSQFTFTAKTPGQTNFTLQNNNQASDTQGFLRKNQKGKNRIGASVKIDVTESAYFNTTAPMVVYPQDVNVTFERNIPGKNTPTGRFTFESQRFSRSELQFDSDGVGDAEIIFNFVEVIDVA